MSLDVIQQQARTILDMHKLCQQLINQRNPKLQEKIKQARKYILGLSRNIQRLVEEERQNVS